MDMAPQSSAFKYSIAVNPAANSGSDANAMMVSATRAISG